MYQVLQKFDIHWHDGGPSIAMMCHLRRVSDLLCNWKSCLLCYMKDVVLHCSIFFKWNKLVRVRVSSSSSSSSCYALAVMSNRWNQYNFLKLSSVIYMGHRWILVLLLISIDWYKHSNTKVLGTKCIINRFWCIIWRPKRGFWSKCPHCIMGYITHLGSIFFLFALALNLAYIDYSLCQIWSAYMLYLRCCDCSNKCLFLVFQQAEVLLNFFWCV